MSGDFLYDIWEGGSGDSVNSTTGNFTEALCAVRSQGSSVLPYSSALLTALRIVQATYYIVLFLLGSVLNLLIIVLVGKFKSLQTLSFAVALQIVVLNLYRSVLFLVSALPNIVADRPIFSGYLCVFNGFLLYSAALVRTFLMIVLVIDRFMSIFAPYFYPRHSLKIVFILSILSWLLSVVGSVLPLPGILDCYSFVQTSQFCFFYHICSRDCSLLGRMLVAILTPVTIIPFFLYGLIYCKAKKLQNSSIVPSGARRNEWKATFTFFLLFISLVGANLPNIVVGFVISLHYTMSVLPPVMHVLLVMASIGPSFLVISDPIVIMRNKDVSDVISMVKTAILQKFHMSR